MDFLTGERRDMTLWYPMRIAYAGITTTLDYKKRFDEKHIENFLPMSFQYTKKAGMRVKRKEIPALCGLIFVKTTQAVLTDLKMTDENFEKLRYILNPFKKSDAECIMTVPDRQMENFMKAASVDDDRIFALEYNQDFLGKPGKSVEITDGPYKGVTGVIKRIKKNQCVVVEIKGVCAVAITSQPYAWLKVLD